MAKGPVTAPMLSGFGSMRAASRDRGAVAWRMIAGIALAAALVWIVAMPSIAPPEPRSRAVAGPIGVRVEPAREAPVVPAPAVASSASQSDPFAGVDVRNNSVLRHIAGIEDKNRTRQHASPRDLAKAPADQASPPPARAPAVPSPAREESAANSPAARRPGAAPAVVAVPIAPQQRVAAAPSTTAQADAALSRAAAEAVFGFAAPEHPVAATAADPEAGGDRVTVAALGKAAAPQPAAAPLRVTHRTVPVFPVEAMRAGVQSGHVIARVTIEADGRVSGTQIISATPLGYFERESRRALATWRYEPPGQATSADVELVFNRD
jgi:protein TonB